WSRYTALTVQAEEHALHERECPRRKHRFRAARSGDRTHRATDGHLGSAARHCELAARLAAHLRRHPRQRHTSLSSRLRRLTSLRRRRPSSRGGARGPPFGIEGDRDDYWITVVKAGFRTG